MPFSRQPRRRVNNNYGCRRLVSNNVYRHHSDNDNDDEIVGCERPSSCRSSRVTAASQQQQHSIHTGNNNSDSRRDFLSLSTVRVLLFSGIVVTGRTTATVSNAVVLPDIAGILGNNKNTTKKKPRLGGLPNKIRSVGHVMDELQRDLMQERWDLVVQYPTQLRSYVPLFTSFTDSAFPSDIPTDKGLRVALRYEVGRFFASLERLRAATNRKALDEAYVAYSDMALHYDRYLHVGGLYTYYDAIVTNEVFFKGISRDSLVYADPKKDPALVRDLIVLIKGPDMGKTGIVIGIYPDGSNNCVVKLDKYKEMREIRVVPRSWAAKRLGEQDPDDVFLIPRTNNKKA